MQPHPSNLNSIWVSTKVKFVGSGRAAVREESIDAAAKGRGGGERHWWGIHCGKGMNNDEIENSGCKQRCFWRKC